MNAIIIISRDSLSHRWRFFLLLPREWEEELMNHCYYDRLVGAVMRSQKSMTNFMFRWYYVLLDIGYMQKWNFRRPVECQDQFPITTEQYGNVGPVVDNLMIFLQMVSLLSISFELVNCILDLNLLSCLFCYFVFSSIRARVYSNYLSVSIHFLASDNLKPQKRNDGSKQSIPYLHSKI